MTDAVQVEALKQGQVTKPVVAWVSGTCAKLFKSEVQFGHAGAKSGGDRESAQVSPAPHTLKPASETLAQQTATATLHACPAPVAVMALSSLQPLAPDQGRGVKAARLRLQP